MRTWVRNSLTWSSSSRTRARSWSISSSRASARSRISRMRTTPARLMPSSVSLPMRCSRSMSAWLYSLVLPRERPGLTRPFCS